MAAGDQEVTAAGRAGPGGEGGPPEAGLGGETPALGEVAGGHPGSGSLEKGDAGGEGEADGAPRGGGRTGAGTGRSPGARGRRGSGAP